MSQCTLRQALRRGFQKLEQSQTNWTEAVAACRPLMASLGNLAEQLAAVRDVRLEATPLRDFPHLRARLRFRLLCAVDSVLASVGDRMCDLQCARDAVSNQVAAVMQIYLQHVSELGLHTCTCRSATEPSLADMMEWLQDAERFYQHQLIRRKALIDTLKSPTDNLADLQTSPGRWESLSEPDGDQLITDVLVRVSFFRESQ